MTSFIRRLAIQGRHHLAARSRQRRLHSLAQIGNAPMSVLFYHRVADTHPNDWTISNAAFEQQVDFCRQHRELVSLEELQRRSLQGSNHSPTVTFTFDDGYAENCRFAIPLLMRHRIPCTYFVTLENVLSGKPFQHDLARGIPLPCNTVDELRAMVDGGIEIGLHTRTHADLSGFPNAQVCQSEIVDAAAELSDLIGQPIRYFAFPFGFPQHLSAPALAAVRRAGFKGFCSAYGDYNFADGDHFHIRRFHGDADFAQFQNWMLFDERKSNAVRRLTSPTFSATGSLTGKRPLRTMFVITSMPVGGAETLLVNMLDRFDRSRIQPEVVCLKEPGPLGEAIADRHIVHSGLLKQKWDISVLRRLSKLMRDRRVDAVVTVGAGDKMFWGRLAAKTAGVPVICSALHSTGWPDGIGRLNRMLTPLTDGFIAVAEHHGVHLSKYEGFPEEKVHIIRNGVDCERFKPSETAHAKLCHVLNVPTSSLLVGIVAALRPEKNHAMFVNVAKAVCDHRDDVHFVIIGDGPERTSIESQISSLGMDEHIHLLGTQHDTPCLVAGLDLFLLCSHNEASPVSILEALACQVPVISTRVGSVAESVVDDETGYLVEPGDGDAMAQRTLRLLETEGLRQRLGRAGRERVLQTGSLEAMVEGYTQLIEQLFGVQPSLEDCSAPETVWQPHAEAAEVTTPNQPLILELPASRATLQQVH